MVKTVRQFLTYNAVPIGFLALLSQLDGLKVLTGVRLFAANRINVSKFLVLDGTGLGLITIQLYIMEQIWSNRLVIAKNCGNWLTSSAAGLGALFAVITSYFKKGDGEGLYVRVARFLLRRGKG